MFARVSTYRGSPDRIDEAIQYVQNESRVEQMPGFRKAYFLVDRQSGRAMTITLWESEEALRATGSATGQTRSGINEKLGAASPPEVEVYEVATEG